MKCCEACGLPFVNYGAHMERCPGPPRPERFAQVADELDELGYPQVQGRAYELVREASFLLRKLGSAA